MDLSWNRTGTKYVGDINDPIYTQPYAGNAVKVLFSRVIAVPTDIDAKNIIHRGQNYNWRENFQLLPVLEWDTYFPQDSVLGMQDMGSASVGTIYSLRLNDSLPTVRDLPWQNEMVVIQSVGKDHPNKGLVLNAWYGVRFTGLGSGQTLNGLISYDINCSYRFRMTGKDWKGQNPAAGYPGRVETIPYDQIRG